MSILLFPLLPLSYLVNIVWDFYWRRRKPVKVSAGVISVGNITIGGSGKTTLTAYIAEKLLGQGKHVALVARGYGRLTRASARSSGNSAITWEVFGDEPAALARAIPGLKMYIDSSKTKAARDAAAGGIEQIIVDDGFQHRMLHRDLDIVCLEGERPFGNGLLLPAGRLREPPDSLRRADIIVVIDVPESLIPRLEKYGKPVFKARKRIDSVKTLDGNAIDIKGMKLVAFCGLGNPDSFQKSLAETGCLISGTLNYGDHHIYKESDVKTITNRIRASGASGAITTMKDLVKAERLWQSDFPLYRLRVVIELDKEAEFLKLLSL